MVNTAYVLLLQILVGFFLLLIGLALGPSAKV